MNTVSSGAARRHHPHVVHTLCSQNIAAGIPIAQEPMQASSMYLVSTSSISCCSHAGISRARYFCCTLKCTPDCSIAVFSSSSMLSSLTIAIMSQSTLLLSLLLAAASRANASSLRATFLSHCSFVPSRAALLLIMSCSLRFSVNSGTTAFTVLLLLAGTSSYKL